MRCYSARMTGRRGRIKKRHRKRKYSTWFECMANLSNYVYRALLTNHPITQSGHTQRTHWANSRRAMWSNASRLMLSTAIYQRTPVVLRLLKLIIKCMRIQFIWAASDGRTTQGLFKHGLNTHSLHCTACVYVWLRGVRATCAECFCGISSKV